MFTRADRLNKKCNHEEYWEQFVSPPIRKYVVDWLGGEERIKELVAEDEWLNNVPLKEWDRNGALFSSWVASKNKVINGKRTYSASDLVCMLKQAAKGSIR